MLVLIVFSFTFSVYSSSKAVSETLTRAPIAIVDEDQSQLSNKIAAAFYPPHFTEAAMVSFQDIDRGMDEGLYTFALIIPHGLQADVVANNSNTAPMKNKLNEPVMGTPKAQRTTTCKDTNDASNTTKLMDQTLAVMISNTVTGITSKCSTVPCSRSRINAAPVKIMLNIVTLFTTCMMLRSQVLSKVGLKRARKASSTGKLLLPR